MTAADKKIEHPYTFCSKSVGMLLLCGFSPWSAIEILFKEMR